MVDGLLCLLLVVEHGLELFDQGVLYFVVVLDVPDDRARIGAISS